MQLRTSTEAIDYINIRQGFRGNDESTNQRLRPCILENKNAKIAKIRDPRKFNPAKVKAYTVVNMRHFRKVKYRQNIVCVKLSIQNCVFMESLRIGL